MTRVQTLRFRIAGLMTSLTSVVMTWGIVLYGLLTEPARSFWFFGTFNPLWGLVAVGLAAAGLALSVVSLIRRDVFGVIGLICSLAVLSGTWTRFVPGAP